MGIHKEIISENSRIRPKDSEVIQLISNNNKAKELIKWEPKTDLEHGLEKTIEFISANLDILEPIYLISSMQALILAGGKGTRLRPYTANLPKPLMPIGDVPILEILVKQLESAGLLQSLWQ